VSATNRWQNDERTQEERDARDEQIEASETIVTLRKAADANSMR
jgi:hypothetical protein